jgi:uncharacterized protein (TIGR02391 family)
MPGRRSVQPQTQLQVKEFRSVEDIDQASAKIKRRIAEVQALDAGSVRWDDQRVRNAEENIHTTLLEVFGSGSPEYNANGSHRFVSLFAAGNLGDDYCQGEFAKNITQAAMMLENHIDRLQEKRSDFGRDTTARVRSAFEQMELHPRIEAASADLYRDGHYRNAVLDASLALVNFVKERSRLHNLDGAKLMSTAFSKNNPVLCVNALADPTDEDEQEGIMHLFLGAVLALRNPRAHALLDDSPELALEYIGLTSLLAKRLDAAKRRTP